jgi:hypothetical protein
MIKRTPLVLSESASEREPRRENESLRKRVPILLSDIKKGKKIA